MRREYDKAFDRVAVRALSGQPRTSAQCHIPNLIRHQQAMIVSAPDEDVVHDDNALSDHDLTVTEVSVLSTLHRHTHLHFDKPC